MGQLIGHVRHLLYLLCYSIFELLLALLSSIISGTPVPLMTVEHRTPARRHHDTAFRGMRETLFCFLNNRVGADILTNGHPAEFWSVINMAQGKASTYLRIVTKGTCSMVPVSRSSGITLGVHKGKAERGEDKKNGYLSEHGGTVTCLGLRRSEKMSRWQHRKQQ